MRHIASLALMILAGSAAAEPGPPPREARTDAEGVPLPDGVIARLGSSRFRHDGYPLESVVFSPDGRLLASAHTRGVSVFDVATGRRLPDFHVPDKHSPKAVRFLADGKHLAIGSRGTGAAELTVYTLADGKPTSTTRYTGTNQVQVIDVTADGGKVLVDDLWGRGIFLQDLRSGKEEWLFEVSEVAFVGRFTPDGKSFGVAYRGKVELRDASTGKVLSVYPTPGTGFGDLYNATIGLDGRAVVWSAIAEKLALLDAKGAVPVRTFAVNTGLNRGLISPDGRFVIALGQAVSLVWDLAAKDDQPPVARLPGAVTGGFSPDGKTLALDDNGLITLWRVGDWKPLSQSADPPSRVWPARFTWDGKRVLGHTPRGWVSWPADGGPSTRLADDTDLHVEERVDVSANGRVAFESIFEPGRNWKDGKTSIGVTDLVTGTTRRVHREEVSWHSTKVSADGRFVSGDIRGQEFGIWDLATGKLLHRESRPANGILFDAVPAVDGMGTTLSVAARFPGKPNGFDDRYASVTITDHRTGRGWNVEPVPMTIFVGGARFSADGSLLTIQCDFVERPHQSDVSLWDVRTGRRLVEWRRRSGRTDAVSLAADGRSLLVGDTDGRLSLIEVATGGERFTFRHDGEILSAAFSPDGARAVASSLEAPVYVWDLIGKPGAWEPAQADAIWAELASSDAKVAFGAIRKLRANPAEAVSFLKERVRLPAAPTDETVAKLLKSLDAARFAERERAEKELVAIADQIRPKLEAERKTAGDEARQRLDRLLLSADGLTPERLRHIRACELLEGIRSADAVRILQAWAAGPAGSRLGAEAEGSLNRLRP
jgi:WD40 repeat protein